MFFLITREIDPKVSPSMPAGVSPGMACPSISVGKFSESSEILFARSMSAPVRFLTVRNDILRYSYLSLSVTTERLHKNDDFGVVNLWSRIFLHFVRTRLPAGITGKSGNSGQVLVRILNQTFQAYLKNLKTS